MAVVNYTSVTIQPPGQMSSIQSILVGGAEIPINGEGTFTLTSVPSSLIAEYLNAGWLLTAFTK
jgi:hypothetical protein